MKILSAKSISKLKQSFKDDINLIDKSFVDLVNELSLSTVERYEIDTSIQLQLPTGFSISASKDKENCILIQKFLPEISPADATDERLWVTLCLSNFKEYFLKRWPDRTKMYNHIFARDWRQRMRDNAIGRLWWTMHLSSNLDKNNPEKFLDTLLSKSDYRSSLLERSSSANSKVVMRSILEITEEMQKKGHEYDRVKFRNFMKDVDFLGKRTLVHSLQAEQLKDILRPMFLKSYGN